MPLEDLVGPNKFLSDLVKEWPLGIDPFAEGDDHIRGFKNVVVNSFPSVGEARRPVSFREGANKAAEIVTAMEQPAGTNLQRPTAPVLFDSRILTPDNRFEWWDGSAWVPSVAMLRADNIFVTPSATPAPGDPGPLMVFRIGDTPQEMGRLAWQLSPDDAARSRLAVERVNGDSGEALVIGGGVMVPSENAVPDTFDLGRGTLNSKAGVFREGTEYSRGWTYTDIRTLDGIQEVILGDVTEYPELANAHDIEVLGVGVSTNSSNQPKIRLGVGGSLVTTGYYGASQSSTAVSALDDCFGVVRGASWAGSYTMAFSGEIFRWDPAANIYNWKCKGVRDDSVVASQFISSSTIQLAGAMDRVGIVVDGAGGELSGQARMRFR